MASQGLVFLIYSASIALLVYLGVRSLHALANLRREKREIRDFFDDELVREIRSSMVAELSKSREAAKSSLEAKGAAEDASSKPSDPLAALLVEIYEELYSLVSEEEEARKREIEALKSELEKLKAERESSTQKLRA